MVNTREHTRNLLLVCHRQFRALGLSVDYPRTSGVSTKTFAKYYRIPAMTDPAVIHY